MTAGTRCWFDGALDPDGRAAFGFLIARDERVIATCSSYLETCPGIDTIDSIATELAGLNALLKHLIVTEATGPIVVHGDCAPVISVVSGYSRIVDRYERQVASIEATLMLLPPIRFEWIPRSLNHRAHNLAQAGLKNHQNMRPLEDGNGTSNGDGKTKLETNGTKRCRSRSKLRRKARQLLTRIIDHL